MLAEDAPLRPVLMRGWRRRCPNCGEGALLYRYLKVHDHCAHCGQPFHHHRADDGPAYLSILVVGHLMTPILLFLWQKFSPPPWLLALEASTIAVVMSLYLLPRIKGAMIAFQWAKGMHGFGRS